MKKIATTQIKKWIHSSNTSSNTEMECWCRVREVMTVTGQILIYKCIHHRQLKLISKPKHCIQEDIVEFSKIFKFCFVLHCSVFCFVSLCLFLASKICFNLLKQYDLDYICNLLNPNISLNYIWTNTIQ
jgi:hypothetical protein